MKIEVYKIIKVYPISEDEEQDILDILNLPSLKYGYAEFLGSFSHYITKSDLKKCQFKPFQCRYYNMVNKKWFNGLRIGDKLFAKMDDAV